jgi:hypothetical protein
MGMDRTLSPELEFLMVDHMKISVFNFLPSGVEHRGLMPWA